MSIPGFEPKVSTFQVVDLSDAGNVRRYQETFDEAFYDLDGYGNVDIVLRGRSEGAGNPTAQPMTQVVHIRSVWRSQPGRTVSHATQINAVVGYFVTGPSLGDSLEGAGSVFYDKEPPSVFQPWEKKDVLTGTVDKAVLRPKRQLTTAQPLFRHAEISGEFRARHDPRQVRQIVNDLARQFGPLPPPTAEQQSRKPG